MRRCVFGSARKASLALFMAATCVGCPGAGGGKLDATPQPIEPVLGEVAEAIFDGGFKGAWRESGTAVRQASTGGPASVTFDFSSEWILSRPGLDGHYGGLQFLVKEPLGEGEFLEVRLGSDGGHTFRAVKLKPDHRTAVDGGWTRVFIPMVELDPDGAPFDRVVFRPFRPFDGGPVTFDRIALATGSAAALGPPQPNGSHAPGKAVSVRLACEGKLQKISPYIYGTAVGGKAWTQLGVSVRRWGGNLASVYNWESNVSNTGADWFFENNQQPAFAQSVIDSTAHGALTALTVPTIGWVAKDSSSYSFPVSVFGPQAKTDPYRNDVGNGERPSGEKIPPGPPTRTSVEASPEWIKRWLETIRASDVKHGQRQIYEYILDNEPMLWSGTHRDVHPEPLGYDELLDRTIRYGTVVRQVDPSALIAGPAEWGWPAYFNSAKDAESNKTNPDRTAHGGVPLIEWYLRKLRDYERTSGVRLLDVVDLHYYPAGDNLYGGGAGGSDPETQERRLRSTRGLWDPTYLDESWVNDKVRLLPRMHEWIDNNYPGRGISIGEWNFGGEKDVTGALATAEALGRFAQFGVTSAFYWLSPEEGTTSSFAFLAYRNFDGKGGRFLDWYVPTSPAVPGVSFFASRDEAGTHAVVIVINMNREGTVQASLDFGVCGTVTSESTYTYSQAAPILVAGDQSKSPKVEGTLAPWSLTVFDVALAKPGAPAR
jgi:hypothetical protein